jgi:hypothetical protein
VPRKIVVIREDGTEPLLSEVLAADEAQLQERIKRTPELIPIEDFGMTGPMMVIGRETSLPSGAIDLVGLARSGELLLIEFKTGPQNPDFRQVMAQLLDYGSDLWQMAFDEFQALVARRYFASDRCEDVRVHGKTTVVDAARSFWIGVTDSEETLLRERITQQLERGAFHYIVIAQRFSPTMETTVGYLNSSMTAARFYAVELVRFAVDAISGLAAFEARTILKPSVERSKTRERLDEEQILQAVGNEMYKDALRELLAACRGLGLRSAPGTSGTSLRLVTPFGNKPISVAWLFPPGVPGWMGFTDLTLGYHPSDANAVPQAKPALERYEQALSRLMGVVRESRGGHLAYHFNPDAVISNLSEIIATLSELTRDVNEGT